MLWEAPSCVGNMSNTSNRENGRENGNYRIVETGAYRDSGKENGNQQINSNQDHLQINAEAGIHWASLKSGFHVCCAWSLGFKGARKGGPII